MPILMQRLIPYSNRRISWHTGGYYNARDRQVKGMLLHCVSPAAEGGVNALLDPEIAYIHLSEHNSAYIYSARPRSIEWRDDETTRVARDYLTAFLNSESEYIFRHRLEPAQGLLCNNVLHNRSAFEDDEGEPRLLYRVRYFDRIQGS